jgi:hypothetical protein
MTVTTYLLTLSCVGIAGAFAYIILSIHDMATSIADIRAAQAAQNEALTAEIAQINAKLDELAAGGTEEERAALIEEIRATTARISGIIPDAPTEPSEPPIE